MKSISENWNKGPLEVSSFTARTPEAFVQINFSELSTPAKGNVGSICSRKMADSQQEEWVFCDLTRPSLLPYAQLHGRLKNQEPTVSGNLQPSNHQRRHNRVWTTPKPPPQGISIWSIRCRPGRPRPQDCLYMTELNQHGQYFPWEHFCPKNSEPIV